MPSQPDRGVTLCTRNPDGTVTRFRIGVDTCSACGTTGQYDCPQCGCWNVIEGDPVTQEAITAASRQNRTIFEKYIPGWNTIEGDHRFTTDRDPGDETVPPFGVYSGQGDEA